MLELLIFTPGAMFDDVMQHPCGSFQLNAFRTDGNVFLCLNRDLGEVLCSPKADFVSEQEAKLGSSRTTQVVKEGLGSIESFINRAFYRFAVRSKS